MEPPRPSRLVLPEFPSITQGRVAPHLNPLEDYECPECGRLDDSEHDHLHTLESLTQPAAITGASRRATARRSNPLPYKQFMRRPSAQNEAFAWPCSLLASDWQVAGEPGDTYLHGGKWAEWEPTEVPTQVLPPPARCIQCDVGTTNLRGPRGKVRTPVDTKTLYRSPRVYWSEAKGPMLYRRYEEIPNSNLQPQGVISPGSAPELSALCKKYYDQHSPRLPLMLNGRYPKRAVKEMSPEMRDILVHHRRMRKGGKSHATPIDDSTTDTEAAEYRAAPQMKERLLPEGTTVQEVKQRFAERSPSGRTRPSESSGADRPRPEIQTTQGERRKEKSKEREEIKGVATVAEEFEKRNNWRPQERLNLDHLTHTYGKVPRKPFVVASSAENLGVIAESLAEERPKSQASKKKATKTDASTTKSKENAASEDSKPLEQQPPSLLQVGNGWVQLKIPPLAAPIREVIPEASIKDDSETDTSEKCIAMIDNILAERGMHSVKDVSEFDTTQNLSKENQNELKVKESPKKARIKDDSEPDTTKEICSAIDKMLASAKDVNKFDTTQNVSEDKQNELKMKENPTEANGTRTRVVSPNKTPLTNSPRTAQVSAAKEDSTQSNLENCIAILSQLSVKDEKNDNLSEQTEVTTDPKVDRRDVYDMKTKLVSELTEQLIQAQSANACLSATPDVISGTGDTSVVSTTYSLEESSVNDTTQNFIEDMRESGSLSRVSEASKSTSSRRNSRCKMNNVVKKQVKLVRFGLGQLEELICIQSMMDESSGSKQSNIEST